MACTTIHPLPLTARRLALYHRSTCRVVTGADYLLVAGRWLPVDPAPGLKESDSKELEIPVVDDSSMLKERLDNLSLALLDAEIFCPGTELLPPFASSKAT